MESRRVFFVARVCSETSPKYKLTQVGHYTLPMPISGLNANQKGPMVQFKSRYIV